MNNDPEDQSLVTNQDISTGVSQAGSGGEVPQAINDRYVLERLLGKGGFGEVFKAWDRELQRFVAVKVTRRQHVAISLNEQFLHEARVLAGLDHPNIVPVFDVGCTPLGDRFVVSKFIDGNDLSKKLHTKRPSRVEAIAIVADIAQAMAHAHTKGLIHRDIKPANILLDQTGKPYLADFGISKYEQDLVKTNETAGTPAYMSPEQWRGEGHLVDHRSDIYSLGVVLFELLTGRRPFDTEKPRDLSVLSSTSEAKSPRLYDSSIPAMLERVCLKALARRASERYSVSQDFADDLRYCLQDEENAGESPKSQIPSPLVPPGANHTPSSAPNLRGLVDSKTGLVNKVVPKGLRSFDSMDADFFLSLLPGPKDRYGLPESIRFWISWVARRTTDARVGLIYGPSGCGKTSLVRAGILPKLPERVHVVYIEASASNTESKLLRTLASTYPAIAGLNLVDALTNIRRQQSLAEGSHSQLLIVIDQFEQWLHATDDVVSAELTRALRQCDGQGIQTILMVRDDFWLSVTRFLRELDVAIPDGENSYLVDLFDESHAQQVLGLFGVAYDKLPDQMATWSKPQKKFLKEAVEELADNHRVSPVRLSLFADMMKSREWVSGSLEEVGRVEGLGVTFLEETFAARQSPMQCRIHQSAATQVLASLLPERGTEIKGRQRSYHELQAASGYAVDKDFEDLITLLDRTLKLITPVDDAVSSTQSSLRNSTASSSQSVRGSYMLTHDYLVPAIRKWISMKQQQTLAGRADLKLEQRTEFWSVSRDKQQLPPLIEWLHIVLFSHRFQWNSMQKVMLRDARNYYGTRISVMAALLILMGSISLWMWQDMQHRQMDLRAQAAVKTLLAASLDELPRSIESVRHLNEWTVPKLREQLEVPNLSPAEKWRGLLALSEFDPQSVAQLYDSLKLAEPDQLPVIMTALNSRLPDLGSRLRTTFSQCAKDIQLLRIAAAMLLENDQLELSDEEMDSLFESLSTLDTHQVEPWLPKLAALGPGIIKALETHVEEQAKGADAASMFLSDTQLLILGRYAEPTDLSLVKTVISREPLSHLRPLATSLQRFQEALAPWISEQLKIYVPSRGLADAGEVEKDSEEALQPLEFQKLRLMLMLWHWGSYDQVWQALDQHYGSRLDYALASSLLESGVSLSSLREQLNNSQDARIRQLLLMAMGKYPIAREAPQNRAGLVSLIQKIYASDPDAGVHGAAKSTLNKWDASLVDMSNTTIDSDGARDWFSTPTGLTMSIVRSPSTAMLGQARYEWGRQQDSYGKLYHAQVNRTFAIATHELNNELVEKCYQDKSEYFKDRPQGFGWSSRTSLAPAIDLNFFHAAILCRWLTEREGMSESDQCFPPYAEIVNAMKEGGDEMKLPADYLKRKGYRLPTSIEWELACRAGSVEKCYFPPDRRYISDYAWCNETSKYSQPVGMLMPNPLGLFDMHGNAAERSCSPPFAAVESTSIQHTFNDQNIPATINKNTILTLKGDEFPTQLERLAAGLENNRTAFFRWPASGLRVVRTLSTPETSCTLLRHSGHIVEYEFEHADVEVLEFQAKGQQQTSEVEGKLRLRLEYSPGVEVKPDELKYQFSYRLKNGLETYVETGEFCPAQGTFTARTYDDVAEFSGYKYPSPTRARDRQPVLEESQLSLVDLGTMIGQIAQKKPNQFEVNYDGQIELAGGWYELNCLAEDGCRILLDGHCIIDNRPISPIGRGNLQLKLEPGKHRIQIEYYHHDGICAFDIDWRPLKAIYVHRDVKR